MAETVQYGWYSLIEVEAGEALFFGGGRGDIEKPGLVEAFTAGDPNAIVLKQDVADVAGHALDRECRVAAPRLR